jgi:hypothetical protein
MIRVVLDYYVIQLNQLGRLAALFLADKLFVKSHSGSAFQNAERSVDNEVAKRLSAAAGERGLQKSDQRIGGSCGLGFVH